MKVISLAEYRESKSLYIAYENQCYKDIGKELQKGYMKLLSSYTESKSS